MVVEAPSRVAYRFDRFTLDPVRGTLLDAGGTELALRPKSFALLRYLAERAGRPVGRAELMAAVWPGLHVTEDSVVQCVVDIRRALGDDAQVLLRTLPRRGYLLDAPVSRDQIAAAAVLSGATADEDAVPRPPAGGPMVVVLPFEDIGGEPGRGYFADGLTRTS
jgi:DNA-binding winged helix-turn-helix (wHTH) protein